MSDVRNIISIGGLCDRRRLPLQLLKTAIRTLGVKPVTLVNGVEYFDEADCERLETEVLAMGARQLKRLAQRNVRKLAETFSTENV